MHNNENNMFAKRIKCLRIENGLSGEELGKIFGVSKVSVWQWENGINYPNNNILLQIANYFNVSIDFLFGRIDERKQNMQPSINKLKQLRLESNISQKDLAKYLNVGERTISMWENNQREMDHKTLLKVSSYFHVSVDYLLGKKNIQNEIVSSNITSDENFHKKTEIMTFGKKFKNRRIEMGLTQEQFANEFNKRYNYSFAKSTISNYENDLRTPEMNVIIKLAEMMNISIDYLLGTNQNKYSTNRLYILRKENGMTVRELGDKLNISYPTITNIENGKRGFSDDMLLQIANYFNVSTDYLLGVSDIKNSIEDFDIIFYNDMKDLSKRSKEMVLEYARFLKMKEEKQEV